MEKKNHMEFKSKLNTAGVEGNKSDKQVSATKNITKFYKSQEEIIKFHTDYLKMLHKAAYDSKYD